MTTRWSLRRRLVVGIAGVVASMMLASGILSIVALGTSTITVADAQLTASISALSRSVDKFGHSPGAATDGIDHSRAGHSGDGDAGGGYTDKGYTGVSPGADQPDTAARETGEVRTKSLVDFVGHGRGSVIAILWRGDVVDSALFSDTGAVVLTTDVAADIARSVEASGGTAPNRTLELGELGRYRLATVVNDGDVLVAAVPLAAADQAQLRQGVAIAILTVLALIGTIVGTIVVVRLALRPLGRVVDTAVAVTSLKLDAGDHGIAPRVAPADTDPRTEAGQVGEALNQLLDHVDTALSVRAATDRRMRRFVTDASHELRTPLAAIQGYAELTRQDSAELPEVTEYSLARIESEARRMSSLVADLLLLARLDEGQDLHVDDVDLADLLLTAVNDARASAPGHTWIAEVPDMAVVVRGDRERLHQLLVNLLSNAQGHTPAGSIVTTALRVGDPGLPVQLSVRDNGPGIDADLLPVIFERFARGDASRTTGSVGIRSTGLGLAIAQSIAEAHGGTIRAFSSPAGTTFTVALPLPPAPSRPSRPSREL
ncbi:cell wall metabolism sensor histidine kinase WalK [Cryobacterium sp. PAMC25264]|uniref:sensor histidine kinase n=1 Tax=Cryobacterium sp. PAMC25264 TaxID=2861288 RepID=UPI001C634A6E|nr:HAMP domain-containing sensor histidine kinase [Cryobacterium sp. PAMC25264]QYF73112.1 HAMP domain-containing histidine kinase [Cryobacterium sp. PAMC25264]